MATEKYENVTNVGMPYFMVPHLNIYHIRLIVFTFLNVGNHISLNTVLLNYKK
jgi:hypothetical protein